MLGILLVTTNYQVYWRRCQT